jgi:hypothetical protein
MHVHKNNNNKKVFFFKQQGKAYIYITKKCYNEEKVQRRTPPATGKKYTKVLRPKTKPKQRHRLKHYTDHNHLIIQSRGLTHHS